MVHFTQIFHSLSQKKREHSKQSKKNSLFSSSQIFTLQEGIWLAFSYFPPCFFRYFGHFTTFVFSRFCLVPQCESDGNPQNMKFVKANKTLKILTLSLRLTLMCTGKGVWILASCQKHWILLLNSPWPWLSRSQLSTVWWWSEGVCLAAGAEGKCVELGVQELCPTSCSHGVRNCCVAGALRRRKSTTNFRGGNLFSATR